MAENDSSLYSSDVASFRSKNLCGVSIPAMYSSTLYLHCRNSRSIHPDTSPLPSDLRRVDQIFQDLVVHIGQRAAARPLLLHTRIARRLAQHSALRNEYNMTVRKLLLQFSCQPASHEPSCHHNQCKQPTLPGSCGKPSIGEPAQISQLPFCYRGHQLRGRQKIGELEAQS